MSILDVLDIQASPNRTQLTEDAGRGCDFPGALLVPKLQRQWGKSKILVQWADLSVASSVVLETGPQGRAHKAGPDVVARHRVLGTAWTDGRIYIDVSCEDDPELTAEVLLSEFAHQVDFHYLTDAHREAIWDAVHPGEESNIGAHDHDWFGSVAYNVQVGEAWMGLFTRAYSDVAVSLDQFVHKVTDDAAIRARAAVTPELGPPPWDRTDEPEPAPEPEQPPNLPPPPEPPRSWWRRLLAWLTGWLR